MNATESVPSLSKLTQWTRRHRSFVSNFIVLSSMILGALPGMAMLFILPMLPHHVSLTVMQLLLWAITGATLSAFGTLFGALVGYGIVAIEKYVSPETFPSEP